MFLQLVSTVADILTILEMMNRGARALSPPIKRALQDGQRKLEQIDSSAPASSAKLILEKEIKKYIPAPKIALVSEGLYQAFDVVQAGISALKTSNQPYNLPDYSDALFKVLWKAGKILDEKEIFYLWGKPGEDNQHTLINSSELDYDQYSQDLWLPNTQAAFRKCKNLNRAVRRSSRRGKISMRRTHYHPRSNSMKQLHEFTHFDLALTTGKEYKPVSKMVAYPFSRAYDVILIRNHLQNQIGFMDLVPIGYGTEYVSGSIDFSSREFGLFAPAIANDVIYYFDKLAAHLNEKYIERDNIINSLLDLFRR